MAVEKAKKRGWFQVHLSTAGVLMIVAVGLVWVNTKRETYDDSDSYRWKGAYLYNLIVDKRYKVEYQGWPFAYIQWVEDREGYHLPETYIWRLFIFVNLIVSIGIHKAVLNFGH